MQPQYQLLDFSGQKPSAENLAQALTDFQAKFHTTPQHLIINLKGLQGNELEEEAIGKIKAVQAFLQEKAHFLVIMCGDNLFDFFEEMGIGYAPTLDEAQDYLYMEILQHDLGFDDPA